MKRIKITIGKPGQETKTKVGAGFRLAEKYRGVHDSVVKRSELSHGSYEYDKVEGVFRPTADVVASSESSTVHWLGMRASVARRMRSDYDLLELGDKGISKYSIEKLSGYLGVSKKSMAEDILDISVKTLERKESNTKLDKKISSHAIEIAKIVQHAFEVFGEEEKVRLWLNRENAALNNRKPVSFFDTLTGLTMVNDVLGRIEEGVYS